MIRRVNQLQLLDALRQVDVLRHLPLGALDRMVSRSQVRRFGVGEVLIEEGTPGDAVLVLLEGHVSVRLLLADREQRTLAVRRAGSLVGEMALVDDLPRSATVTAESAVSTLCVPQHAFLEAVSGNPGAALELLRTLSLRLRESDAAQIEVLRAKAKKLTSANDRLSRENRRLKVALDRRFGFEEFVGESAAAEAARSAARRAAESELPVLLVGETGTGKELLARAIHAASERRDRPFVALNCALFSEALLESELFGHARGAFTGATAAKLGLVEAADGGTLFLDELSDMPRPIQAALLRFLELHEFRRLGETEIRRADVRIIAAMQLDVDEALESGRVRRDLHFRLDVFRILLPPLRERREDVPELVVRISEEVANRLGREPLSIAPDALAALLRHPFPGNVRELRNEIERLYAMREGTEPVGAGELSERIRSPNVQGAGGYAEAVRAFKLNLLRDALARSGGSRSAAARALALHPSNLIRMIRELGIDVPAPPRGADARPGSGPSGRMT
jgi:transcriptional regulator with PAS, ATPase and Fis domain